MKGCSFIVLLLFMNQACSNFPYASEVYRNQNITEEQTCTFVLNEFNKIKNYSAQIYVQQGYEKLAKEDYFNDRKRYFSNLLYNNLSVVKYPYIDRRCNELNSILHNEVQFKQFQRRWLEDYLKALQENVQKANFKKTDKCYNSARRYYKLFIDENPNIEVAKIQYNECLQINLRRK